MTQLPLQPAWSEPRTERRTLWSDIIPALVEARPRSLGPDSHRIHYRVRSGSLGTTAVQLYALDCPLPTPRPSGGSPLRLHRALAPRAHRAARAAPGGSASGRVVDLSPEPDPTPPAPRGCPTARAPPRPARAPDGGRTRSTHDWMDAVDTSFNYNLQIYGGRRTEVGELQLEVELRPTFVLCTRESSGCPAVTWPQPLFNDPGKSTRSRGDAPRARWNLKE